MNLFPNPATDLVTLQLNNDIHSGQVKIEIFENTGRLLFETAQTVSDDETTLSVSELKAGYYLVKITQGDYSSVKALYKK
jgi:hypothetical protein